MKMLLTMLMVLALLTPTVSMAGETATCSTEQVEVCKAEKIEDCKAEKNTCCKERDLSAIKAEYGCDDKDKPSLPHPLIGFAVISFVAYMIHN